MYKEIIIIILIVILIIVGNVITQNYTKDTVKIMQNDLDLIKDDFKKEEKTEEIEKVVEKKVQEAINHWNSKKSNLAYYLEHDELEKIEEELAALNANIVTNDYEQGIENLDRCYFLLEYVKEKETITLSNIF